MQAPICSTEILSIEIWAVASEVTPIYYSKCYLHNISTARAHDSTLNVPLFQFGPKVAHISHMGQAILKQKMFAFHSIIIFFHKCFCLRTIYFLLASLNDSWFNCISRTFIIGLFILFYFRLRRLSYSCHSHSPIYI